MEGGNKQTRIFLWSWPRSISTAVEKCLSFIDGVQTWHEPYTVAQFKDFITAAENEAEDSPGAAMIKQYMQTMFSIGQQTNEFSDGKFMPITLFDYPFVKSSLEEEEPGKKYILIKDMAAAVLDHYDALPDVPTRHTFIIRHPYRFLLSQRRNFLRMLQYQGDPKEFDTFKASPVLMEKYYQIDAMFLLWKHVKETGKDPNPLIFDAEDIMNYPDKILPKYLSGLGIPFDEKYLTWDASEEIIKTWKGALEQVIMGKQAGVFDKAFKSSCFLPNTHSTPKREDLTPDLLRVVDNLMAGYEEMYENRIKPE